MKKVTIILAVLLLAAATAIAAESTQSQVFYLAGSQKSFKGPENVCTGEGWVGTFHFGKTTFSRSRRLRKNMGRAARSIRRFL